MHWNKQKDLKVTLEPIRLCTLLPGTHCIKESFKSLLKAFKNPPRFFQDSFNNHSSLRQSVKRLNVKSLSLEASILRFPPCTAGNLHDLDVPLRLLHRAGPVKCDLIAVIRSLHNHVLSCVGATYHWSWRPIWGHSEVGLQTLCSAIVWGVSRLGSVTECLDFKLYFHRNTWFTL